MHRTPVVFLLAALLPACDRAAEPPDAAPPGLGATAFVNAAVWDGTGDEMMEGAVLVVRGGRVESLGRTPPPEGAEIVDLEGRYVIPGLINAHGHVSGRWAPDEVQGEAARVIGDLELLARYGVTTVNSLGGEPPAAAAVAHGRDDPGLDYARVYVAGPVVADTDPAAARARAEANIEAGVDWLKLRVDDNLGRGEKMPWDAVEAVIDAGRAAGVPVATHVFYMDDAARLLNMGTGLIAHSVRDRAVTNDFTARLKSSGVCYVPTLTRELSTFVYAERPDFFDDPFFLLHADRDEMARVSDPAFMEEMAASEIAAGYRKAWVQAMENLRELADAGVPIAMGTDSGPPGRFPGYFEHLELEFMAMAGMRPVDVLRSATSVAADCLGLAEAGRLEPGRWADFVVLAQNPLPDVVATRTLEAAYVAGNPVGR